MFTWKRGHIFDEDVTIAIYDFVLFDPLARVTKVTKKGTKKWCVERKKKGSLHLTFLACRKPLPLTTVELQKAGSRLLKLAPKKVLDVCQAPTSSTLYISTLITRFQKNYISKGFFHTPGQRLINSITSSIFKASFKNKLLIRLGEHLPRRTP